MVFSKCALVGLLALAAGVYGIAEPSCTTAKCVFDDPAATPAVTAYPTTLTFTSAWSITSSAYNFEVGGGDAGGGSDMTTEIQNIETLEPHAASPTSFPATVVMTAITTHTFITGDHVTSTVSRETQLSTWIVRRPVATDLPRHDKGLCGNCTQPASYAPAPVCVAAGNSTGCLRQCAQRDSMWYCYKKDDWYMENVMGRACWWLNPFYGTTEYLILGEPCVAGDRTLDCLACDTYG